MPIRECFTKFGRDDLQAKFDKAVKSGKSEHEAAREIVLAEHENLHNQTNDIRTEINKGVKNKKEHLPIAEYKKPIPQETTTETVPKEEPTEFDKFQSHILDHVANTKDNSLDFRLTTGLETPSSKSPSATNKEIQQAEKPTIEEPPSIPPKTGDELPFGKSESTGISHEKQTERTYDINEQPPIRGVGVSVGDAIQHGKDLKKEGGDPQQAADEFKKDNKISFDALSLVRAEHSDLVRATDKAEEQFGETSKEYKDAKAKELKWYNETVKPMQTEWHNIGQAQQGAEDINTGSYVGLKRARTQATGKDLTPKESGEAKQLSSKVEKLTKQVEDLKNKLTEALDKGEGEAKLSFEEKAKKVADRLRKLKSKPFTFKDENGNDIEVHKMGVGWNDLVELGAKAIEKTGKIADGIKAIIDKVKEEDWYKKLSDNDKEKFEEQLSQHYGGGDILTRFTDKKDNKFETQDAKDIWDYAKENYLDKGADFDTMVSNTAIDLGLKPTQVRDALITPKGARVITDEMYKRQSERNKAIQMAKDWAKADSTNVFVKILKSIPRAFFAAKVFGHGTVGMVTHSGINIYDPVEWKRYWPVFFKQFSFAYGKAANYEKAMQDLQHDPQYILWKRNGLAVDPTERYDEYQFVSKIFQRLGKVGRWLTAGDRGFNALKVYRLERAKALWNSLSNVEKADPNTPKEIAKLVNHSTGTTGGKVSDVANTMFFAPKLELARWNKLVVDPAKAVKTFTNWNNASPSERAAAKIVAKRAGRILATYVSALAVNQGLLSLSGSGQQINFYNPSKKDWLKFKAGGRTIDLTGGMVSLLGFLTRLTKVAVSKAPKGGRADALYNQSGDYISGKFSPFASTVKDVSTHHDFQGNTLPMYDDKPTHSWNKKLTWGEYLGAQQTPIPVAEAFTDVKKQMEDAGVKQPMLGQVLQGIVLGALVGGTGVHIGEEPPPKPEPFTEEDKKDPTFKYFLDKGMELPNTVASSERITEYEKGTDKTLSSYPKEVQDRYLKVHKEFLKESLKNVIGNGVVYVKKFKDENGEPKNKVSFEIPESGDYDEVGLKKLSKEELAQVLHLAQSEATTKTKKELFNQ
jgi:hypothetical protein